MITKVKGRGAFRKRITEMGFVKGKEVTVIKAAPLQDPIEYKILGYHVSLRQSEARLIGIETDADRLISGASSQEVNAYNGTIEEESQRTGIADKGRIIDVAGFKGHVYLMPVGGVESVYALNNKNVAILAMNQGWRYSDRLQVPLFKNEWGT